MFEPSRLTAAMRRRGMTQRDAASKCLVTSQYISLVEKGEKTPSDAMVQRFAEVCNFPVEFFFGEQMDLVDPLTVTFRARRSMSSAVRDMGLGVSDLAVSVITPDLHRRFNLPKVDLPDLSAHSPEDAAAILRARWSLGFEPIQNMVHLLEAKGVLIYWCQVESSHLDAISFWKGEQPFVILNSQKKAGDRGRFDAAHELGHLVLHRMASNLSEKQIEDQADHFASAFLLPAERFQLECPNRPDFTSLYRLKARWKVSIAAMVMRGAELGIFSDWQKRQAFQALNATGMRIHERAPIIREQSKLHRKIFDALGAKGVSPVSFADSLCLNWETLLEMMPVAGETSVGSLPQSGRTIQRGNLKLLPGNSVHNDPADRRS